MSRRGKPLIQINGYTYSSLPSRTEKIRWRCSTDCRKGCHAHVFTLDGSVLEVDSKHNHPPKATRRNTHNYNYVPDVNGDEYHMVNT